MNVNNLAITCGNNWVIEKENNLISSVKRYKQLIINSLQVLETKRYAHT